MSAFFKLFSIKYKKLFSHKRYFQLKILWYLRFPETLSAVDFEGRTAVHYAAVLPDNGHYYNLLQQLGSNSKDLDDVRLYIESAFKNTNNFINLLNILQNGKSADDYYRNPNLLPFNQLLNDFGISDDTIKEMFSDQGMRVTML